MRIVVAALAGVLACWCVTATADELKEEPLPGLKCKIGLPKDWKLAPADKIEKAPKGTKTTMSATRAEGPDGKVCIVIFTEIAELKDDQAGALFKSAKEKKDDKIDKIEEAKDVPMDGAKAHEFVVVLKDKRKFKTLMIVKAPRVYTIVIGGPTDYYKSDEATTIFKSFVQN